MHQKNIITAGKDLKDAQKVLIMIHGRGGSAEDIITLATHLQVADYALLAPQATNHTWYPYSFLSPASQNEPWLSSALTLIEEIVTDLESKGFSREQIYFLGFSQGACLTLEYAARHAAKYGGVVAFTGGLIGDKINNQHYKGNFNQTPVFIGSSNPDPHVPVERIYATSNILRDMGAAVTEKVYEGMGHTINHDEIALANQLIFAVNNSNA